MKYCLPVALLLIAHLTCSAQNKNFIDQPYIEVKGSADTLVTPDEIYIRILLSERDSKDRLSVEEAEQKMISVLKELGIDTEKDLTTTDMTSNFRYYLLKGKDILKSKRYIVKVRDARTATRVLLKLEEAGIANTGIDRVACSETAALENKMRSKAVNNAKVKAVALTAPLSQTVGAAIYIDENNEALYGQLQGRAPGISIRGVASRSDMDYDLPAIDFEKIKVSVVVLVRFVLK